jgi:hypothetical protein
MGMGIEQWLFNALGRPFLRGNSSATEEALRTRNVDWIHHAVGTIEQANSMRPIGHQAAAIKLVGGCELDPLAHYLRLNGNEVIAQTNFASHNHFIRYDTSATFAACLTSSHSLRKTLMKFGFEPAEYYDRFFAKARPETVWLFSTWGDLSAPMYRNEQLDITIPFEICDLRKDLSRISNKSLNDHLDKLKLCADTRSRLYEAIIELRRGWQLCQTLDEETISRNFTNMLAMLPPAQRIFVLLPHGAQRSAIHGVQTRSSAIRYRSLLRRVLRDIDRIELLDMEDYVHDPEEIDIGYDHFARVVYLRMYIDLVQRMEMPSDSRPVRAATNPS